MNKILRTLFFSIFLLFSFSAYSLEIKSGDLLDEFRWTLETTMGWQNITNELISKENGGSTQVSEGLNFRGILFNSFYNNMPFIKSQLNLGFEQKQYFLWTDTPDFHHFGWNLNESLHCCEYDLQGMLPYRLTYNFTVLPFLGYSFIDYTYDKTFSGESESNVMYNSMVIGVNFQHRINTIFSQHFFVSYSPIVFENYNKSKSQFINYGFEILTNTHPVSLTFFFISKRAFLQRGRLIFEGTRFKFTTAETGFALHVNLR